MCLWKNSLENVIVGGTYVREQKTLDACNECEVSDIVAHTSHATATASSKNIYSGSCTWHFCQGNT